ncbi:MAG: tRNA 2-selenouridine(34) synthase MnmH [Spirochaetia bacterium]|nr:tRNA 2-selenouridine(34) synthase MnmH [Spirochaetia bacterium]
MVPPSRIIEAETLLSSLEEENWFIIDVRSQDEYKLDHFPESVNLPVLNNKERAEVGLLYKKDPFSARLMGADYILKNIPGILKDLKKPASRRKICVYCWRGGMRSKSLFSVLFLIGYDVYFLKKGYKAYRKRVVSFFETENYNLRVIYGPSGSGKSDLINALKSDGFYAVNLEEMASHKGSMLGGDFETQPAQKMFESRLFYALSSYKKLNNDKPIIVEGESRKIGKILLPDKFYHSMIESEKIWVELPLRERAKRLAEEYSGLSKNIILVKVEKIKQYFSKEVFSKIETFIAEDNKLKTAELLLEHHYDTYYFKRKKDLFQKKFIVPTWNKLYSDLKKYFSVFQ